MSQQLEGSNKTFRADGSTAMPAYSRVKVTAGVLALAGVTERGIGIIQEAVFANSVVQHVAVRLWNSHGTFKMIAAGAVVLDAVVYAAASGKMDDTASTIPLGKALETASGSGSIIEVLPITEAPAPVSGVAAGYKVARGVGTFDGSNPTNIVTGLTTVVAVVTNLVGTAAPGDNTSVITVDIAGPAAGSFDAYAWKNTGGTDPTLVASTGTETFHWIAIGT